MRLVGALLDPEVLFAIAPAIGRIAAAIRCPEAFHAGLGVIFNMLPKGAPPLMRPVMKMVSNQVLDAMINPPLKLPAYLSLQISGKIPLDLPIPIRSLADAVLVDERVSFASTSPAAAIRRLPQRAMSST